MKEITFENTKIVIGTVDNMTKETDSIQVEGNITNDKVIQAIRNNNTLSEGYGDRKILIYSKK